MNLKTKTNSSGKRLSTTELCYDKRFLKNFKYFEPLFLVHLLVNKNDTIYKFLNKLIEQLQVSFILNIPLTYEIQKRQYASCSTHIDRNFIGTYLTKLNVKYTSFIRVRTELFIYTSIALTQLTHLCAALR